MLVRANVGFAGAFSMYKGEVKECSDGVALRDLLKCGYVEEVKSKPPPKGEIADENKRSESKNRKRVSKN